MEKYIHRENLALLRKRLAESQDDTTRKVLLKLLADEEAIFAPPKEQK
jgi:bacterioferritin (cytochrome b1)